MSVTSSSTSSSSRDRPHPCCSNAADGGLSAALAKGENASAIGRVLGDYLQSGDITQAEQRFTEERIALLKNGDDSAFSIGPIVCYLMQRETEARQLRVLFAEKM